MARTVVQPGSLILPRVWVTGAEQEVVADIAEHTSNEIFTEFLQEKQVNILAIEALGIGGNLWCWVELSPYPAANWQGWPAPLPATAVYYAAIGGGGGALPPVAPFVEAGAGAGTVHTILLPWVIHSAYARVVVQTPVLGAGIWAVQVLISAKTP